MHETDLIAAVLIDPMQLDTLDLTGLHFADHGLGKLYDSLMILREDKFPVHDIAALVPRLGKMGLPPEVSSPKAIAELFRSGPAASSASYYASQIREQYEQRRITLALQQAVRKLESPDATAHDVARWVESQLTGYSHQKTKPRHAKEIYDAVIADMERPRDESGGIMIGIPSHDEKLGGWKPGELIILAARPGVGKTSLGVQVAWHQSRKGRRAALVSLEMTGEEIVHRILAAEARVDSRVMRTRSLTRDQRLNILAAGDRFESAFLTVWDPPRATMSEIRGFARSQQATSQLDLLVVDYIGLIRPRDNRKQRYEQVQEITGELKALAKELECPVLALCQLNREADKDTPRLSHLRESGSIEQDADAVLFLHRERDSKATHLIVAKNRHGGVGKITLDFHESTTTFTENVPEASECSNYDRRFESYSQGDKF
jgi:replicative DNA helicase